MRKFNITVDGHKYSVEVEEVGSSAPVAEQIYAAPAPVAAPIAPVQSAPAAAPKTPAQAPAQAPANGTKIVAPMPGMILDFKAAPGEAVKKNQPIIVLEAMKMENNIVAPCDGTVTFNVTKGANVETGTLLAVIS